MKIGLGSLAAFFLMISAPLLAPALAEESFGLTDAVKQKDGVSYLCSGIGESKDDARVARFPLKIVFATVSSALYSDVDVRVTKEGGSKVFDVFCDGAWLLVQLDPGKYNVTGTDKKKQTRSCSVHIGSTQTQCVLRWPD